MGLIVQPAGRYLLGARHGGRWQFRLGGKVSVLPVYSSVTLPECHGGVSEQAEGSVRFLRTLRNNLQPYQRLLPSR
jgi:hypothetical protein